MSVDLCTGPLSHRYQDSEREATASHGVLAWLQQVNTSLAPRLRDPLAWCEDQGSGPECIAIGDTGYGGVRLLAVYAERADLELPDDLPESWLDDPAYAEASKLAFAKSHYAHILVAERWLPGDFDFTFVAPGPDGADVAIGSLAALDDQVRWLDERTLNAGALQRQEDAASHEFVAAARYGIGGFRRAVEAAKARAMPLWLPLGVRNGA